MAGTGPGWADSVADVEDYITNAHGLRANLPRAAGEGQGIHIGIIDSAYQLPDELTADIQVVQSESNSFIEATQPETGDHCQNVFKRIQCYAPAARYTLYQAVNTDGKLPLGAYSDAISQAIADDVDIVNISAGDPWPGPVQANPNVNETKRLIDEGIPAVIAAGNYLPDKQDERPPVHCPSALTEAISVGAMVTECPHDSDPECDSDTAGPYYWVPDDPDVDSEIAVDEGAYCGEAGCRDMESCITNQQETDWDYNPLPTGGKPDVLAPVHIIGRDQAGKHFLTAGTSFAAPLVTGSLARILSELQHDGDDLPQPHEIRDAVRAGCAEIPRVQTGKYDAMGVRSALGVS